MATIQWLPVFFVLGFFPTLPRPLVDTLPPSKPLPVGRLLEREKEIMRQSQLEEYLDLAKQYTRQKKYTLAQDYYRRALQLDPKNSEILKNIQRIEEKRFDAASERFQVYRDSALTDVTETWQADLPPAIEGKSNSLYKTSRLSRIPVVLQKMENIRFPVLDFQEADIRQVVQYFSRQSRELDPEKEGINFVIQLGRLEKPITVSMSLRDVSLLDALDFIKKISGIHYRVEDYAVLILASEQADSQQLLVREFTVQPDFFENGTLASDEEIRRQFNAKGIFFEKGAAASYFPNTSKLVVRGTPHMLNLIQNLITLERTQLPQVEIETRFIEFSEDKLKELRFRWQVGADADIPALGAVAIPGRAGFAANTAGIRGVDTDDLTTQPGITSNTLDQILGNGLHGSGFLNIGGILNDHGMRLLVNFIHRIAGGNLMSAPKITLKKGENGSVRIAREFVYPRKYESPIISDEDGLVIPSNPEDFNFDDPKNIGVMLKVFIEEVNPELELIDLKLEDASVTDFEGFINYGNPIIIIPQDGKLGTLSEGIAYQPVFSVRRAQTRIQLRNGQTLVMGGFIREDSQSIHDSVPLLSDIPLFGRLFKGDSEKTVKRNLIIMTTARLVYPNNHPHFASRQP